MSGSSSYGSDTHVHAALGRVSDEQEHFSDKIDAFGRFYSEVKEISPASGTTTRVARRITGGGGMVSMTTSSSGSACDEVLKAFARTIRPYSIKDIDGDESLMTTVSEELGRDIAVSLSSETDMNFTKEVKRAVLSETAGRRSELHAMKDALDREKMSLSSSAEVIEDLQGVLSETEEGLLSDGFTELRSKYETLSEYTESCERAIEERQDTLHRTTNQGAAAGVRHRDLVEYLYEEFPTEYPALSTLTRLNEVCTERKREVSTHMSRCV